MESRKSSENFTTTPWRTRTPQEIRELDRKAIEELAVPGIFLMEQASYSISRLLECEHSHELCEGVRVLVGHGNNGGDGMALARHLHDRGYPVELWFASVPPRVDPRKPWSEAEANLWLATTALFLPRGPQGGDIVPALQQTSHLGGLWIDALLGTGFQGELRPHLRALIEALNRRRETVVAIDVPSGLDAANGSPSPVAVIAHCTATLGASKAGFAAPGAARFTGKVAVLPIGWPAALQ